MILKLCDSSLRSTSILIASYINSSATLFVLIEQHLSTDWITSGSPLSDVDKVYMVPKFDFEFPTVRLAASLARLIGVD